MSITIWHQHGSYAIKIAHYLFPAEHLIVNQVVVRSSRTGALFGASGMGNNYVAKDLFVLCCRNGWSRTLAYCQQFDTLIPLLQTKDS